MRDRPWEIGICGTFDVANYGDLLFPLIAEAELTELLGAVNLHRFSYNSKTPPAWPYEVTSISALPQIVDRLDGLLIGGGFLIRFDKQVAPGYSPPVQEIHHPTGYWLSPALIALQHNVPVVWNAPGMHCNDIPAWAKPLLDVALSLSRYVSVRDEPSKSALQSLTSAAVEVVPDTAFALPRLRSLAGPPSGEFNRLAEMHHLTGPYIVVQATLGLEGFVRFLRKHSDRFRGLRILALPIGPALGERHEIIDRDLPGVIRLADWPKPLLMAELIGRAEAVVGHSYHLFVTALVYGVPVFTRQDLSTGKYSAIQKLGAVFELPEDGEPDVEWFVARMGRRSPSTAVKDADVTLRRHWDRIAAALREEIVPTSPRLDRFWQSLPGLLERSAEREDEARAALAMERAETRRLLDDLVAELTAARGQTDQRNARIADMEASISWRCTAPLRSLSRELPSLWTAKERRSQLLNLSHIEHHPLQTEPYQWAAVDNLFTPSDAAKLVATYPSDHFKLISAHGGEKDYEYEARRLIGMDDNHIAYPDELSDVWRSLARNLLSPEYRGAMTRLTGLDLRQAPMEVNVFHYGPGSSLGPHRDLPDKIVTHVLYFNRSWNSADGGCLTILRSADPADLAAEILPIVGHSAVIVRSDHSWHAVSRVVNHSASSRRSVTVTFYRPGSVSSMWPPEDSQPLHDYRAQRE